jgi:hypothetical protein
MTSIFLVIYQQDEDSYYVLGVYSNKEKAINDWGPHIESIGGVCMEEYKLDEKNLTGENQIPTFLYPHLGLDDKGNWRLNENGDLIRRLRY